MVIQLSIYFVAGIIIAAMSTFNVKMIGKSRAAAATIGSFVSTFVGMSVVVNVAQDMGQYGLYGILAYCTPTSRRYY